MRESKKTILLFVGMVLLLQLPGWANGTPKGPLLKLVRGAANVATAPAEYWVQFEDLQRDRYNPAVTLAGGAVYGTFFAAARVVTGALEILTFPFPVPPDYRSIMDPPTALEAYKEYQTY